MTKQSHQWGQEKRDVRQGDQCVGQGSKEKRSQEDVYLESFILRIWLVTVEASKVNSAGQAQGRAMLPFKFTAVCRQNPSCRGRLVCSETFN